MPYTSLCFLEFITVIHRFGLASAEKSPVGWHCSNHHKIGKISTPTILREFMSDQIRM